MRSGSRLRTPLRSSDAEDGAKDEQRGHRESKPARVRQQREQQRAEQPLTERPVVVALDLGTRVLDERTVLNARWARGHARHAAEARIEVADEGRATSPRGLRARPSSGTHGRAACPSPRPTAHTSDTTADRSRSGHTRRSAPIDGWSAPLNAGPEDSKT